MNIRKNWRVPVLGAGLLAALSLAACDNTLIFAERSGFNLAIAVNDDPATPLQVNAGLRRSVAGLVPPVKTADEEGDGSRADGEAVSMFSGFRLEYEENPTSVFQGDLTIRTQFASGFAARTIAAGKEAPLAVSQIVDVQSATFSHSDSVQRIRVWLASDPANLGRLDSWVAENAAGVGTTLLRFGAEHEALRLDAINDLTIP